MGGKWEENGRRMGGSRVGEGKEEMREGGTGESDGRNVGKKRETRGSNSRSFIQCTIDTTSRNA